jgi:agmatinase
MMEKERVFLTLDIDGIDPAFAPGTGTPEPFGLTPLEVKKCINMLGKRMVGFDITEVSPPYDEGNTAALAARMMREAIAVVWKNRK